MPAADSVSILRDLDVRQKLFTDAVCSGRSLSPERLAPFLDGRPWTPADLVRGGVLDSSGYREDAMRTVGACQRAFDMMCERALSRVTQGEVLAKKQMVQEKIADSYIQLESFRLLVLHAGWTIDQVGGQKARRQIAMVKVLTPQVLHDIVYRALHIHGSLGTSNEMPLMGMWAMMPVMGIADGPTEVHKLTIARQVLKEYKPSEGLFPSAHLPPRVAAARAKFADLLEHEVAQH